MHAVPRPATRRGNGNVLGALRPLSRLGLRFRMTPVFYPANRGLWLDVGRKKGELHGPDLFQLPPISRKKVTRHLQLVAAQTKRSIRCNGEQQLLVGSRILRTVLINHPRSPREVAVPHPSRPSASAAGRDRARSVGRLGRGSNRRLPHWLSPPEPPHLQPGKYGSQFARPL